MKPPEHVDLGAHRFEVRSDPDTGQLLRDEGSRGDSRHERLIIRLDLQDRPHTAIAETLLHEVVHCVWNLSALRAEEKLGEFEERIIQGLSPGLLEALRRNPKLVQYLTADAA